VLNDPSPSPNLEGWCSVRAEWLVEHRFPEETAAAPAPRPAEPGQSVWRSCRILIVDDDLGIRLSLAALLEEEGYVVETATNGQQALECIERERPAVVMLDMRMPIMDGWSFARELRSRGIVLPIVVMTAARDAQAWAGEIAATAYAPKPFDYPELLAILDRICSGGSA